MMQTVAILFRDLIHDTTKSQFLQVQFVSLTSVGEKCPVLCVLFEGSNCHLHSVFGFFGWSGGPGPWRLGWAQGLGPGPWAWAQGLGARAQGLGAWAQGQWAQGQGPGPKGRELVPSGPCLAMGP